MIISDEVKRILQNNDFSRTTNTSINTNKQSSSKEHQTNQSPAKRKLLKFKNGQMMQIDKNEIKQQYYTNDIEHTDQIEKSVIIENCRKQINNNQLPNINLMEQQQQENQQSLFQEVIEIFPLEHEIWKELIENGQTVEEVVNNNSEYFIGLLKVYYCKQEVNQQDQHLKAIQAIENKLQQYQKKQISQYIRDYSQNKLIEQQPYIDQSKVYEQYYASNQVQLLKKSVYNHYHVPIQFEKVNSFKPDYNPNQNQSTFLSTYNSNFMNWKGQYQGKITQQLSPKQQSTLPFIAETNYSKNFKQLKTEKVELQNYTRLGPFYENPQQLIKETTSQHFFQSHFSVPSKLIRPTSPRLFSTKQSFEGQYTSSFNKSYVSKNQNSESQHSSFADKFYDCSAVKGLIDKKIRTRIF